MNLAMPEDAPLDDGQRNRIWALGVSVFTLGLILFEQGRSECVEAYGETVRYDQRIKDTAAEAVAHYNIGRAYHEIPGNVKLDVAEAAYGRSLELFNPDDVLAGSLAVKQIGMVHHARSTEAH